MNLRDVITVVVPTSPIPSHPSTAIIEETVASVRAHLPESEIIITIDGVRSEQERYRTAYEEYKRQLLILTNDKWHNVLPIIFNEYNHQASMLRKSIDKIETPLMIYVEHDTPLCEDKLIEWEGMCQEVLAGNLKSIRLHHYNIGCIHPEHEYLMLPKTKNFVQYIPTVQWSQRPHLTTVDFYRRILDSYFSTESRTMIEDRMYGVIMDDVAHRGKQAVWEEWRLAIYAPDGHMKRSRDLKGRADADKFD